MDTPSAGRCSIVVCALREADAALADAVPLFSGANVLVAAFHRPRQPRSDASEAATELIRRVASRAAVARSAIYEIATWPDAVRILSEARPDLVVLPWRRDPDVELLAGQIRRHSHLPLALIYPGGDAELDEAWEPTYAPRPWIP